MDINKIYFILNIFIRSSLALGFFGAIFSGLWIVGFVCFLAFILTFIPYIFEKRFRINLPVEFELVVIVFIYLSLFLGEVKEYYTKFFWWDIVLHTGSGIALGLIGFMILFVLYRGGILQARPVTIAFFTFCFAVAIGTLWEIFEFSLDSLVGSHMQASGHIDTMWDLIVDSIGAFIASVLGYFYLKGSGVFYLDTLIRKFIKNNSKYFK